MSAVMNTIDIGSAALVDAMLLRYVLNKSWLPATLIDRFWLRFILYSSLYSIVFDAITRNWGWVAQGVAAGVMAWLLLRRDGKGKWRKAAKMIGDKSKAILRKMTEKMRDLAPSPLLPEPV